MKILTIAIPSYNSMDYMRNCIESLLPGGEDVEILIVDDGSKMILLRSRMNTRRNILVLYVRFIRKTVVMERQ